MKVFSAIVLNFLFTGFALAHEKPFEGFTLLSKLYDDICTASSATCTELEHSHDDGNVTVRFSYRGSILSTLVGFDTVEFEYKPTASRLFPGLPSDFALTLTGFDHNQELTSPMLSALFSDASKVELSLSQQKDSTLSLFANVTLSTGDSINIRTNLSTLGTVSVTTPAELINIFFTLQAKNLILHFEEKIIIETVHNIFGGKFSPDIPTISDYILKWISEVKGSEDSLAVQLHTTDTIKPIYLRKSVSNWEALFTFLKNASHGEGSMTVEINAGDKTSLPLILAIVYSSEVSIVDLIEILFSAATTTISHDAQQEVRWPLSIEKVEEFIINDALIMNNTGMELIYER